MKSVMPEACRCREGKYGSQTGDRAGAFRMLCPLTKTWLNILVCAAEVWVMEMKEGPPWDHVSVSTEKRVPSWKEMCWVKELFFADNECVVQFHPPKSQYINNNPRTLHLWRPLNGTFPMPPAECV